MEKRWAQLKKFEIRVAAAAILIVIAAVAVLVGLKITEPYAVYADGTKVDEAWVVKAGDKELCLVGSKEAGTKVIDQVRDYYCAGVKNLKDVDVNPKVTIEPRDLERGEKPPEVLKVDTAANNIITTNEKATPVLTITTTQKVTAAQKIKYATKVKKTAKLYEGQKKVAKKGKAGKKIVVSNVVMTNGKTVGIEVVDTEIAEKPVAKVVQKGTKEDATLTADAENNAASVRSSNSDNSLNSGSSSSGSNSDSGSTQVSRGGDVVGRGSGSEVVSYALQFVGNPYVYGGTSLTNGADCSGFTMSVYAHFGISLPHSSGSQASCGRGVSYSEAKPGDLICYPGHVAIYMGNGKIVHASTPSSGIKVSSATYRSISTVRRIIE